MFIKQFKLLFYDLEFYTPVKFSQCNIFGKCLLLIKAILFSRDFRLNLFIRILLSNIFIISNLSSSFIFYFYGSSISKSAVFDTRLRFIHARSIVIGPEVIFEGDFAYLFNNITIGKLVPGSSSLNRNMPVFKKGVVLCAGSIVLGDLIAYNDCVVGANSTCTMSIIDKPSTIVSYNKIVENVFFRNSFKFFPPAF